jgi:hypothetical protein
VVLPSRSRHWPWSDPHASRGVCTHAYGRGLCVVVLLNQRTVLGLKLHDANHGGHRRYSHASSRACSKTAAVRRAVTRPSCFIAADPRHWQNIDVVHGTVGHTGATPSAFRLQSGLWRSPNLFAGAALQFVAAAPASASVPAECFLRQGPAIRPANVCSQLLRTCRYPVGSRASMCGGADGAGRGAEPALAYIKLAAVQRSAVIRHPSLAALMDLIVPGRGAPRHLRPHARRCATRSIR